MKKRTYHEKKWDLGFLRQQVDKSQKNGRLLSLTLLFSPVGFLAKAGWLFAKAGWLFAKAGWLFFSFFSPVGLIVAGGYSFAVRNEN